MWIYQEMHHCIHLLQSRRKYDDYGDISEAWADMGRVWEKIVPKTSSKSLLTYEVTVRQPHCKVDRIEWNGKAYKILRGMEEDARKTWRRFLIAPI